MKAFLALCFIICFFSCSTTSQVEQSNRNTMSVKKNTSNTVQTEQNLYANIDIAVLEGSKYLISKVSENTKVAIVNIQSPTINLSNYVIDSISMHLLNLNKFILIERAELDILKKEQMYQLSGEVSDETAISIGKQIGAKYIITGSVLPLGNKYSFRIKIINAETAQNIGTQIFQFNQDGTILALLQPPATQEVARQEKNQQTIIQGDVNITNNTNTTINGDVYVNMPKGLGW